MNKYLITFNAMKINSMDSVRGLLKREMIVMVLIIGLFQQNKGIVTKYDIKTSNKVPIDTSYSILKALERKGYITSKKPNKGYYSKSYISLASKGLTFKRELTKLLNTPIG